MRVISCAVLLEPKTGCTTTGNKLTLEAETRLYLQQSSSQLFLCSQKCDRDGSLSEVQAISVKNDDTCLIMIHMQPRGWKGASNAHSAEPGAKV